MSQEEVTERSKDEMHAAQGMVGETRCVWVGERGAEGRHENRFLIFEA